MDDLLLLPTVRDVERTLAARLRALRKIHGWTQAELATRAGLGLATVARLERDGHGQIGSLLRIGAALGRLEELGSLLRAPEPTTLDELRRRRS